MSNGGGSVPESSRVADYLGRHPRVCMSYGVQLGPLLTATDRCASSNLSVTSGIYLPPPPPVGSFPAHGAPNCGVDRGLIHRASLPPQACCLLRDREVPMCQHHSCDHYQGERQQSPVGQSASYSPHCWDKCPTETREEGLFGLLVSEHPVHHGEKAGQS